MRGCIPEVYAAGFFYGEEIVLPEVGLLAWNEELGLDCCVALAMAVGNEIASSVTPAMTVCK